MLQHNVFDGSCFGGAPSVVGEHCCLKAQLRPRVTEFNSSDTVIFGEGAADFFFFAIQARKRLETQSASPGLPDKPY